MKQNKDKLALFDFCDTLVGFQTANQYVRYIVKNFSTSYVKLRHLFYILLLKLRVIKILESLFPSNNIQKRIILWQIKGVKKDVIDIAAKEFYLNMIKPNLISKTMDELQKMISNGWEIAIVSGGYNVYIEYFAQDYGIKAENIIANKLVFRNNIFTGTFDVDCMGEMKVKMLCEHFQRDKYFIIAYSDSESDMPMLKWADEGYVIYKTPNWIKSNNLNMIVW